MFLRTNLKCEHSACKISYTNIYRGTALNNLGEKCKSHDARGLARRLRQIRKVKGTIREWHGHFNDVPSIHECLLSAENRSRFGNCEGDTVHGNPSIQRW